jgi:hypothetical protein
MKKIILYSIISFTVILAGLGSSFLIAKRSAEKVRESYAGEVSQLKCHLIIFHDGEFAPYWLFIGEYANLMTGATFDVYVSLLGNVQTVPLTLPH